MLEAARRSSARAVNALMTATYREIGRRIVEFEQGGKKRAGYGAELLEQLAQFGRGFSRRNLQDMRSLYQAFSLEQIWQTLSAKSVESAIGQTLSGQSTGTQKRAILSTGSSAPLLTNLARAFPLPWSHYVLLIRRARSPGPQLHLGKHCHRRTAARRGARVRSRDRLGESRQSRRSGSLATSFRNGFPRGVFRRRLPVLRPLRLDPVCLTGFVERNLIPAPPP